MAIDGGGGEWELGMLPVVFQKAESYMRNEELFLFDLMHLCCIWPNLKCVKMNAIGFV